MGKIWLKFCKHHIMVKQHKQAFDVKLIVLISYLSTYMVMFRDNMLKLHSLGSYTMYYLLMITQGLIYSHT